MKKEHKIIALLLVVLFGTVYFLITSINKNEKLEAIYRQNELARDSLMKKIQIDSNTYYHKYASIQSNLIEKESALKQKDETILTLNTKEVLFRKLVDSLTGRIVKMGKDTAGIPFGSVLAFQDTLDFYRYNDSVFVERFPKIKKELEFIKFREKNFLTRDVNGRWSGYSKFEPEFVNKYISIENLEIIVDRDEFVRVESDIDKFRLSLIPAFGILQKGNTSLGGGLKALINKKHLVEVTKGIGNDWLWVGYGYTFDLIK